MGIGIGSKVGTTPGGVGTGFFVGGLNTIGMNKVGDGVAGFFDVGLIGITSLNGLVVGFFVVGLFVVGFFVVGLKICLSSGIALTAGNVDVAWNIISTQSKMVLRKIDMVSTVFNQRLCPLHNGRLLGSRNMNEFFSSEQQKS